MSFIHILSILLFIYGSVSVWIGYHNVDIAYNILKVNDKLVDISIGGTVQNSEQAYASGVRLIFFGYFCMLVGFMIQLLLRAEKSARYEEML